MLGKQDTSSFESVSYIFLNDAPCSKMNHVVLYAGQYFKLEVKIATQFVFL